MEAAAETEAAEKAAAEATGEVVPQVVRTNDLQHQQVTSQLSKIQGDLGQLSQLSQLSKIQDDLLELKNEGVKCMCIIG